MSMNRQKLQFSAWSQSALTFVLEPWGDVFLLIDTDVLIVEWEQEKGRSCQIVWHPDQIAFWAEGFLSFLAVHHYDEQGIEKRSEIYIDVDGGTMDQRYEIILYWSAEDEAFVAEVPELPGCAAHGSTQTEALRQVQDAMGLWLDVARETGLTVPEPKGRRLVFA